MGARGPRRALSGPNMASRGPKRAHLEPQMGPRWGPKGPKMGPKWAQDGLSEAFEKHAEKGLLRINLLCRFWLILGP